MNTFNASRFRHVFINDVLQQWRRIWIATLALVGIGLICYLTNIDPHSAQEAPIYLVLFPVALFGGGLILTSTIFADLHHPLQSAQYLTLPCSNLERFVSRYLLTGLLYYLYVLLVYAAFDWAAAQLSQVIWQKRGLPFTPFSPQMLEITLWYFGSHVLAFGGAIYFRSFTLIKTGLFAVVTWLGLALLDAVVVRLVFWDHFTTWLPSEPAVRFELYPVPRIVLMVGAVLLYLWVLFIAYLCLREHEVQREL
jgi:hypothetical protein